MEKIYSFDAESPDGQHFILTVFAEMIDPDAEGNENRNDSNTIKRQIVTEAGRPCTQIDLNTFEIPDLDLIVTRTSPFRK